MFLNEVALGKEHHITQDNWRLTAAPAGHDCIIAKGWSEPGKCALVIVPCTVNPLILATSLFSNVHDFFLRQVKGYQYLDPLYGYIT